MHKKHHIAAMHANILNANFYICLLSAQISLNLAISVASQIKKNKQGLSQMGVHFLNWMLTSDRMTVELHSVLLGSLHFCA